MATITGLTAARMMAIEAASVVAGIVQGNNLILTKFDGSTIDAGSVRGPIGPQGIPGSITVSPAGGSLSGNYPDPGIANGVVTAAKVAADNKDGAANVASMRTLGTGNQQAASGTHSHDDTGWVDCVTTAGDSPFGKAPVTRAQYRKIGRLVHFRFVKDATFHIDYSNEKNGNFPNTKVLGDGSIPASARPGIVGVNAAGRMADTPASLVLTTDGAVVWTGGFGRNYDVGSTMQGDFTYLTSS